MGKGGCEGSTKRVKWQRTVCSINRLHTVHDALISINLDSHSVACACLCELRPSLAAKIAYQDQNQANKSTVRISETQSGFLRCINSVQYEPLRMHQSDYLSLKSPIRTSTASCSSLEFILRIFGQKLALCSLLSHFLNNLCSWDLATR